MDLLTLTLTVLIAAGGTELDDVPAAMSGMAALERGDVTVTGKTLGALVGAGAWSQAAWIAARNAEIHPEEIDSHTMRGYVYYRAERAGLAIPHYLKAWQLDPESEAGASFLVILYLRESQHREAAELLARTLKIEHYLNPGRKGLLDQALGMLHLAEAAGRVEDVTVLGGTLQRLTKMALARPGARPEALRVQDELRELRWME